MTTAILCWTLLIFVSLSIFLAVQLEKYVSAFKATATDLWAMTQERNELRAQRDKLHIQNAGLKAELTRECMRTEKLEEELTKLGVGLFSK